MRTSKIACSLRGVLGVLGLTAVAAAGCAAPAAPSGAALLRVTNAGAAPIQALVIQFPEESVQIGDVPPGGTSVYRRAGRGVFGYAAYQYRVGSDLVSQPVVDWVGASPLPGNAFTYVLAFDPDAQRIHLIAVESGS